MEKGELGRRVDATREDLGISKTSFAKLLKVSRMTVNNWASGVYDPDRESLRRISEVLGKPVSYFFVEGDEVEDKTSTQLTEDPRYFPDSDSKLIAGLRHARTYEDWVLNAASTYVQARDGKVANARIIDFCDKWTEAGEQAWKDAISKIGPPKEFLRSRLGDIEAAHGKQYAKNWARKNGLDDE